MNTISVIIPLYNKEAHIERCLRSIRAQTCPVSEIVIVDDGSTDNSVAVAKKFLTSQDQLLVQANRGAATARKVAIENCHHEFVASLDSDDEWCPNHLETLMGMVEKFPEANAFASGFYVSRGPGRMGYTVRIAQERLLGELEYFRCAQRTPLFHSSNSLVRKSAVEAIGGYPVLLRRYDDLVYVARTALNNRFALTDKITSIIHLDAENRAVKIRRNLVSQPWFKNVLWPELKNPSRTPQQLGYLKAYMRSNLLHYTYYQIQNGETETALSWLMDPVSEDLNLGCKKRWLLMLSKSPRPVLRLVRFLFNLRVFVPQFVHNDGVKLNMRWSTPKQSRHPACSTPDASTKTLTDSSQ